ncbi:hypothetical protein [Flavobacterium johnsoniae]|uniref:Uncharacterized protein n=1 Tax=Flavobacterium johnsoniae TaxID=986 RepID=A0A1J7BNY2_FLAJO|nr:hypothetical protein [Flavobacterium johnsoniae]OIV40391.1 hypothetical protein BKM63_15980 [Flavobacterium johnsoniae]
MDRIIFTRLELYNLVWKFPIIQIAKHYEISSMGIKNACEKMEIPLPGSKHWVKLNYKRQIAPKLAEGYTGNNYIIIMRKAYESQLRKIVKATPLNEMIKTIESDSKAPLLVSDTWVKPNVFIKETQIFWENKKSKKKTKNDLEKVLHLNVAGKNLNRALLFLDALIKLLEYRGHQLERMPEGRGILFTTEHIKISIHLREALKRIPPKFDQENAEYIFTGDFILQIKTGSYMKEWREGRISLEKILVPIVAKLELIAAEEQQWKETACETSLDEKVKTE